MKENVSTTKDTKTGYEMCLPGLTAGKGLKRTGGQVR